MQILKFVSLSLLLSLMSISILSCNTTLKSNVERSKVMIIHFTGTVLPQQPILYSSYEEWIKEVPKAQDILIKSGTCKINEIEFKIIIEDRNKNGLYTDIGVDFIGIVGVKQTHILRSTSISNISKYKDTIYCQYENTYFKLFNLDKLGKFINITTDIKNTKTDILLQETFPNLWDVKLIKKPSEIVKLKEILKKEGNYIYVNFWATYCTPCIEEIPIINKLAEKRVSVINFCALNGLDNAMFIIDDKSFQGSHCVLTEELGRNFSQTPYGFPFGILYDKNGKLIKYNIRPKEVLQYLQ